MKERIIAIAIALACGAVPVSALDVQEGRMKMAIQDASGKFVVSYLKAVDKGQYVPLIFDQDPRTTQITLLLDGKTYKLGESGDFRTKVSRTSTGASIEWRSSFMAFRILATFIKSKGAPLADGIRLDFELENVSERDVQAGVRFLVDTYLGENSRQHFLTQTRPKVGEETAIRGAYQDAFWVSPGDAGIALQWMLDSPGVTKPDSVVFGNWKRLQDSSWNFDSVQGRSFDLLPYSINDSAVAMWYEPQPVQRGKKRVVSIAFGNFNENAFTVSQEGKTKTDELFQDTVLKVGSLDEKRLSVQTDLIALKDLVSQIDQKISKGGAATDEEIAVYREILDRLKKRRESY